MVYDGNDGVEPEMAWESLVARTRMRVCMCIRRLYLIELYRTHRNTTCDELDTQVQWWIIYYMFEFLWTC